MRTILTLFLLAGYLQGVTQQTDYTIYFDLNKDSLPPSAIKQLSKLSSPSATLVIKEISVYGYADKYGAKNYNKRLSQKRAIAVAQAFNNLLPAKPAINLAYYGKDSLLTTKDEEQQLNRRVLIVIIYARTNDNNKEVTTQKEPITKLEAFNEDAALQQFNINLDETVIIRGSEGTRVKILPGSIQTIDGKITRGLATLLIKEYYKPGQIILAGLTTTSGDNLLQTGGMVWFRVTKNGDTTSTDTRKAVEIRMPVINDELNGMGVFAMHNRLDSAGWNYINQSFNRIAGYWDWPQGSEKTNWALNGGYIRWTANFNNWIINGKDEEEYHVVIPAITIWPGISFGNVAKIKKVRRIIKKVDSVTLNVQAHITYRHRGAKAFNTKYYDTAFNVRYVSAEYTANVSRLNWINCDRFLYAKKKTSLHIKTASCEGAGIVLYFKKLHAYMPAYCYKNLYEVNGIPENEDVCIIAFGKEGNNFYFANKDYTVGKNNTVTIDLQKITSQEFKNKVMDL